MRARVVLVILTLALVAPGAFLLARDPGSADRAQLTASTSRHLLTHLDTTAEFAAGKANGISTTNNRLTFSRAAVTRTVNGKTFGMGAWESAVITPGFGFTEVIASWNARVNINAWANVMVRARSTAGTWSGWKQLARWRTPLGRTTFGSQADGVARVATDTLKASSGVILNAYQLRVELLRKQGTPSTPYLNAINGVASRIGSTGPTSKPLYGAQALAVPRYSQMIHQGEYPQYGGGGQAWCSPTSLSMILGYYGRLPSSAEYSWVKSSYRDRWVDHVARQVYDSGYDGAGNWAFNTAYGATRVPDAMLTRLNTLRDIERFIRAKVPVAVSISFGPGQLTGAPIRSTAGHLVVVAGFTRRGNVIVNDPAAPDNNSVRRVYDRAQFERAWQNKSRGVAYLVQGPNRALPRGYVN